jgi:acetyl esterase/lipase
MIDPQDGSVHLPARVIPPPPVSAAARTVLGAPRPRARPLPDLGDRAGWRRLVEARDAEALAAAAPILAKLSVEREVRKVAGVEVHEVIPRGDRLLRRGQILLNLHGGALLFGGGALVPFEAAAIALRSGRVVHSPDYRMPPDHPYPAGLDDALALYREMLRTHAPGELVVCGTSAGGNLAAALLLRARDEGLPLPAGALLLTPELDLTESGDSFETLMGLDSVLTERLLPMNRLYANGADLSHPYLSPLFGDFGRGFPPTLLQAGTRDLFLSNAVRMHRALRRAGVRAELHVFEGMPHGGFGGLSPEDRELSAELRAFLDAL